MTLSKRTCPHCGNRNSRLIEDNGLSDDHPGLTLLCVARVNPGDDCFGEGNPKVGEDGKVPCSMQWNPNED